MSRLTYLLDLRSNRKSKLGLLCICVCVCVCVCIYICNGSTTLAGRGLILLEVSISHSDTPHSVGLLWTSDQPDAETCTWQHTTLTRDLHAHDGIRTRNRSKRTPADPRLTPRGHRDRLVFYIRTVILLEGLTYNNSRPYSWHRSLLATSVSVSCSHSPLK